LRAAGSRLDTALLLTRFLLHLQSSLSFALQVGKSSAPPLGSSPAAVTLSLKRRRCCGGFSKLLRKSGRCATWSFVSISWSFVSISWSFVSVSWSFVSFSWSFVSFSWSFVSFSWSFASIPWSFASIPRSFAITSRSWR